MKILILRHGHRDPLPQLSQGSFGDDLPLTPEGWKASHALGKSWKEAWENEPFAEIVSSPLKRCLQTAEALKQGMQQEIPIHSSNLLGDPGPFIFDPQMAAPHFYEQTPEALYRRYAEGTLLSGFRPFAEGMEQLLDFILKRKVDLSIMITHDFVVAALIFYLTHTWVWIHFLQGVILNEKLELLNETGHPFLNKDGRFPV